MERREGERERVFLLRTKANTSRSLLQLQSLNVLLYRML